MRVRTGAGLAVAVGLLAGCATSDFPRETGIVRADLAIDEAKREEAAQYAPTELREAEQKLDQAEDAIYAGQQRAADALAEQALVNAQLATAEAQSERAQQLVQQAQGATPIRQQQRAEVTQ